MRFPTIADVASELRQINKQQLRPDDADEGIDVRLQVYPDGEWAVHWGSADYDQDHRGYWGSSSVPGDNRRFDSKDVARDLIDQARENKATGGDDDAVFERPAAREVSAKKPLDAEQIRRDAVLVSGTQWFKMHGRAPFHAEAPDWVRTGKALCGADIARPAMTTVSPMPGQQKLCQKCLQIIRDEAGSGDVREAKRTPKKRVADFDNEEEVLADVAKALDVSPEDLSIEEDGNLSGFGVTTTIYHVELGSQEYTVVKDEDEMRALALAIVKQDLEEDPTMFNASFIEQHIDKERLAQDLRSDVESERYDYFSELSDSRFWKEAEGLGMDVPEEDEDGDLPEPSGDDYQDAAERASSELLRDPMAYLEDIYGAEDAAKKAIDIAGIDIDAAAEDAVDTDGPAHFVARYDSEYHTTPSGFVYWRDN